MGWSLSQTGRGLKHFKCPQQGEHLRMALEGENCCSQQGSNGDSGFNVMADFPHLPLNGCTDEGGCGQRIIVTVIIFSS